MGRSIDKLIAKCQNSGFESSSKDVLWSSIDKQAFSFELQNQTDSNIHQLVLSFLWHIIKVCCWSASKIIQEYSAEISYEHFCSFLVHTVITVLIRTRHKGAMESAQEALSIVTQVAFTSTSNLAPEFEQRIKVVEDQLDKILNNLESSVHEQKISVTRRSAGYAMLFTAICSNIHGKHTVINERVVERLLKISRVKVERTHYFDESSDLPSTLSLHILHSLVQCSKLSDFFESRLPGVAIVCLKCFASDVWSTRNAALQLFGATVPKLLGQKKVKEDSSVFNSITAGEFCLKNPLLVAFILKLLSVCSASAQKLLKNNFNEKETVFSFSYVWHKCSVSGYDEKCFCLSPMVNLDIDETNIEKNLSSFLVPLLGLLARLNPGSEIQQNGQTKCYIYSFVKCILPLLGNKVLTIRKLVAKSLVGLLDLENKQEVLYIIINKNVNLVGNNLLHGFLLFLKALIKNNVEFFSECHTNKNKVLEWLKNILGCTRCMVNSSLAIHILSSLESDFIPQEMINLTECSTDPGVSLLRRNLFKLRMNHASLSLYDSLMSEDQDVWEEAHLIIKKLLTDSVELSQLFKLQLELFSFIESHINSFGNSIYVRFARILELLSILLEHKSIELELNDIKIKLFQKLFEMETNIKLHSSVVFSYFVRNLDTAKLKTESKASVNSLLTEWAKMVLLLSTPKMNEDCRLSASKSLRIAFEPLLYKYNVEEILFPVIKAVFNILQDEDEIIRSSSTLIIGFSIYSRSTSINPSVVLSILCRKIVKLSAKRVEYLYLLWDLGVEQLEKDVSNCFNLFESNTHNAYFEPFIVLDNFNSQMEKQNGLKNNIQVDEKVQELIHQFVINKESYLNGKLHLLNLCRYKNMGKVFNYDLLMKLYIIELATKLLKNIVFFYDIDYDLKCTDNIKLSQSAILFSDF